MANPEHLAKLKEGVKAWNRWREQNPQIEPDLSGADLSEASLLDAKLGLANLSRANLSKAYLHGAELYEANLRQANLSGADLIAANLDGAKLGAADLSGAFLDLAKLAGTHFDGADLTACHVYGISAWGVSLEGAIQSNLVITDYDEPPIQIDNLELAQFIYLLLNNEKIRGVIDTITSKVVLILGRFTPERKVVLDG